MSVAEFSFRVYSAQFTDNSHQSLPFDANSSSVGKFDRLSLTHKIKIKPQQAEACFPKDVSNRPL